MKEVYDPETKTTYRVYEVGCTCPILMTDGGHAGLVKHIPECQWYEDEEPE